MKRLQWMRRVTIVVIVVLLSAALGFALKRGTRGDPSKGSHVDGHAADLEGVTAKVEPEHGDEVEPGHGDEAGPGHVDEAEPGHEDDAELRHEHEGHRN